MFLWEKRAYQEGSSIIIGVDEAGRGPLAGPVVAAAVSLKKTPLKRFNLPKFKARIDDSKKLPPNQRDRSFSAISKKSFSHTGLKNHTFIDKKNILLATKSAMREAVLKLIKEYCLANNKNELDIRNKISILIDGNMTLDLPYKMIPIIKGDSKSVSIAAASIIAKVTRDRMMLKYDKKYPKYGFSRHKGYGTKSHLAAIEKYGPCPIHRKSFAPMKNMD